MSGNDARQSIVYQEHLRLLSWGYLVSGCLSALFSLLGLFYVFLGAFIGEAIQHAPPAPKPGPPPEFVAWIFGLLGAGIFLMMVIVAVLKILVYQRLKRRRSRTFCMVVAGLCCLGIPWGTLLGVLTFMVLTRPSVVGDFEAAGAAGIGPGPGAGSAG